MNLAKYGALGELASVELTARYRQLHDELRQLCAAPVKDMTAIDAVIVRLDEIQAAAKQAHRRDSDTQRF